jgi:GNAT superfamily N-acetyltransferase
VLVAWLDGRPVGCGMLTTLAPGTCEIKRMFVTRGERGRGIGGELLRALESVAENEGFRVARLETGAMQPESIALYERNGYVRIPCFGEYVSDPRSLCFEKVLRT